MSKITDQLIEAALRRGILVRSKSSVPADESVRNVASIEFANLGFLVSPQDLSGMSTKNLVSALSSARKVVGADRDMKPVYAGFPEQVENLSTTTLLVEQILHYISFGQLMPDYPDIVREGLPLEDMLRNARKLKVMNVVDASKDLLRALISSPVAISEDDRNLVAACLDMFHMDVSTLVDIAKVSRNAENVQVLVREVVARNLNANDVIVALSPVVKSPDALLRVVLGASSEKADRGVIVSNSNALYTTETNGWGYGYAGKSKSEKNAENYELAVGNLSNTYARAVRMRNISRPARRAIVTRIGEVTKGFNADLLEARRDLWRGVMRAVHPYDFRLSEDSKRAVDIIHENCEYHTLNSLVEKAMAEGDVETVVHLLTENRPNDLLRRLVAILRLVSKKKQAEAIAEAVRSCGSRYSLSTLISAYNGVLSANDEHTRVTRVAGLNNTMVDRSNVAKVKKSHVKIISDALRDAMTEVLKNTDAPVGIVGTSGSNAVPLVRRDASTADRVLDRGQEIAIAGTGDVLRIFGHWNNNQSSSGFMDIGAVVLDEKCNTLSVSTWNSWSYTRDWSTYSGDKLVYPKDSAAEYFDLYLDKLRSKYPHAKYVAMTVQSYSGWPINNVDFLAGAMFRSDNKKGQTFDARTVASAFKPTTSATQAVPFVLNLDTKKLVWIDSSSGATDYGMSSTHDVSVGGIVYDELIRPRLTMGELAHMWATAHGAATDDSVAVDRDALLGLLS